MYGCKGVHRCECASNGIIMSRTVFCTNLSSVPGLSSGPLADAASSRPLEAESHANPGHTQSTIGEGGMEGGRLRGCVDAQVHVEMSV